MLSLGLSTFHLCTLRVSYTNYRVTNQTFGRVFILELEETFSKAEEARNNASSKAMKAVEVASMEVMELIAKIIERAVNEDHSGKKNIRDFVFEILK